MNQAVQSLHGGLLLILLTVPLNNLFKGQEKGNVEKGTSWDR